MSRRWTACQIAEDDLLPEADCWYEIVDLDNTVIFKLNDRAFALVFVVAINLFLKSRYSFWPCVIRPAVRQSKWSYITLTLKVNSRSSQRSGSRGGNKNSVGTTILHMTLIDYVLPCSLKSLERTRKYKLDCRWKRNCKSATIWLTIKYRSQEFILCSA